MPQLEEVIKRSKEIFPALGAKWLAGAKSWVFPKGERLKLRWLDRDEDADNYQGHSHTWIGVDELGTWPDPAPIDKLRATLRSPHGIACVMRATGNPGGPGQQWIKERYIQPAKPLTPFYDEEKRVWRVFIPSRLADNKALIENDPHYIDRLRASGPPWLVQAWLNGDWEVSAGQSFFSEAAFLENGAPVVVPGTCEAVFAIVDTAVKTGSQHDSCAVIYFARESLGSEKLWILDWDAVQIAADIQDTWLQGIFSNLEYWAERCRARYGSMGAQVEDKQTGSVLLARAERNGWPAYPIDSKLTAKGKDERAVAAGPHIYQGLVRITEDAYRKTSLLKDSTKNHFLSQVTGFRLGDKDAARRADDLLDCLCYGVIFAFGTGDGF